MAEAVYILCALTSIACAWMLLRAYARGRARILLWSGLCFAALTVNNILLFVDKVVFPQVPGGWSVEFAVMRALAAAIGLTLLLYGLIWDTD